MAEPQWIGVRRATTICRDAIFLEKISISINEL
jgi:hypothetical protein